MESSKSLNFGLLVVLTAIAAVVLVRSFTVPVKVVPKPTAPEPELEPVPAPVLERAP
ncbi:MAG: hypothetical protein ACO4AI_01260 [Prochlorothrix sp.]|nr:hypothetical protein [Prochlorothrix sp.]